MKYSVTLKIQNIDTSLELNDQHSPKTVNAFVEKLPFPVKLSI